MAVRNYIFRVLAHASFDKMKGAIDAVHEKTGKNKLLIFLDMVQCTLRYGAGYYDYQVFAFYNLTPKQRSTYVTRLVSKKLNEFLNDPKYSSIFENKDEFYTTFHDYLGRGFIELEKASKAEVEEFVKSREWLFGKLKDKECGIGCERIHVPDYPDFDSLYRYFKEKGFCTIEDLIIQHPALQKLYSNAVNSMRIITILDNWGKPHVVYIVQKMGLNGSIVDNNCLFARVDPETGKIAYPAHSGDTTKGIIYYEHPETHVPLVGYEIPYVKEAVKMCLKASLVVPQVRYIGWDVAVTEKGPVIIEGNTFNAHDFWQLPPHTPDGIGMLPVIKKLVPDFKCHYKG